MYPTIKQIQEAIQNKESLNKSAVKSMTKEKLNYLVERLFRVLRKKITVERPSSNQWDYTWASMATARKRKYKDHKPIKYVEEFIEDLLHRLRRNQNLQINYTKSCGANYKYVFLGNRKDSLVKIDWINIPCIKRFKQRRYYYKTIFHEISHCIMERLEIADHLDNVEDEEIVAEASATILCCILGINTWNESFRYITDYTVNSAGYMIHDGRIWYIKKSIKRVLQYVLKMP